MHTTMAAAGLLPAVLPYADLFFCNAEEAELIFSHAMGVPDRSPRALLQCLWEMAGAAARPRLFGITGAAEAHACFGIGSTGVYVTAANPHYPSDAVCDLAGAGDNFRAGILEQILREGMPGHADAAIALLRHGHTTAFRAIARDSN